MSTPYEGLQDFVTQLPEFVQPLLVAGLGMIPYVEGEGGAAIGIIAGINPVVAALAAAAGNIIAVLAEVLVSSRARETVVARRTRPAGGGTLTIDTADRPMADSAATPNRRSKGRERLRGWMVRFGVPLTSILAPLALPTHLTAAFFVASGVKKEWVILWQIVAIVLWTGAVAAAALGVITLLGW